MLVHRVRGRVRKKTINVLLFFIILHAPFFLEAVQKIDPMKSLLIVDSSVVDSPFTEKGGPWSFSRVFKNVLGEFNNKNVAESLYRFWEQYEINHLNGYTWDARSPGVIIDSWPRIDPENFRSLDVSKSPFRLLSIVFRPDLFTSNSAGELRFVYGAKDPSKELLDITLIFEFELKFTYKMPTIKSWLSAIAKLSQHRFGIDYNIFLESLTDQVLYHQYTSSTFKRLRVNEQLFGNSWDMRDFVYDPILQSFKMIPIASEPDASLNTRGTNTLVQWINQHQESVVNEGLNLPVKFRAGRGYLPDNNYSWFPENPNLRNDVIKSFNMKTCTGCHGAVTETRFMHIEPRFKGEQSTISKFLIKALPERKLLLEQLLDPKNKYIFENPVRNRDHN